MFKSAHIIYFENVKKVKVVILAVGIVLHLIKIIIFHF
jgi:hypothetical protein